MSAGSYNEAHSVTSGGSLNTPVVGDMNAYTYTQSPTASHVTDASAVSFGSPPFFELDDEGQTVTSIRNDQLNLFNPNMSSMAYTTGLGFESLGRMPGPGNDMLLQPASVWPANIDEACLLPLVDIYFDRLHATIPVLNKNTTYQRLYTLHHRQDTHFASMILSLCAFALTQPLLVEERSLKSTRNAQAKLMMKEAVKMQDCADFGENPTLEATLCSFFLFATLFGANQHNAAWLRLREAVTLGDLLRLHDPHSYEGLNPEEKACRLRTYWILCITER